MDIRTKLHTILMLVGPTECGKTTFAREVLMPGLQMEDADRGLRANVQYLSSDRLRQELLGYDYDKYEQVMFEASDQAFHLLFERLRLATSFPVNAEFVIVDTTGLSEDFRAKVREIAAQNHYRLEAVVFDYRKRDDYYASERSKKLITGHMNRLRKEVLASLAREGYDAVHKVRAKDFYLTEAGRANPVYTVTIDDAEAYKAAVLPQAWQYVVVGDVHECVDDLKGLLLDYGFKLEAGRLVAEGRMKQTRLVLAGDWIDKGRRTKEMVEFLYDNQEYVYLVLGNHENFIDKYTRGEIAGVDQTLLQTYFDSAQTLLDDPELLRKFRQLVSISQPFYRYVGVRGPSFYVTHAPCRKQYIGKLDTSAVRHQRNFRLDREQPTEPQLAFLKEDAVKNHPYHVFGHIAAKQAFRLGNKVHLDTGAVHGNQLTAALMAHKPLMKSRKSGQAVIEAELPTLFKQERKVSLHELGEEEQRRLHYCSRHKINFISGTMCPADKDEAAGELESLARGLDYFRERGVRQLALQPKYMGSRCNVYLHREPEQCFAVSRNGYRIKQADLTDVYARLRLKFGAYMEERRISLLLLDGELLPWKALGEGLIERQFEPIASALQTELAFLEHNGFEQAYAALIADYEESGFERDQHHMAKSVLSDKYGSSVYQNYKHVHELRGSAVPLAEHRQAYRTYRRQLELYAGDAAVEYKLFAVLKIVGEDGTELVPDWSVSEMFRFVSDDEALLLDLQEPDAYGQAEQYYARLTLEQKMEGVVLKPEHWNEATAPYLKVRNPEYLSIIYGYDYKFPHKYRKLIKQKSIGSKLRTSLSEYRLGQRMLAVPFADIAPENEAYKEIAANLLFEVAQEREIDPRL